MKNEHTRLQIKNKKVERWSKKEMAKPKKEKRFDKIKRLRAKISNFKHIIKQMKEERLKRKK